MDTILAISPHLDDAVFSAGGALARRAAEGCRVVVATVFTESVANCEGFALACQLDKGLPADLDYMALRREEDRTACAIIGAEPLWLPHREAPHRGYESAAQLFGPIHDDDTIDVVLAHAFRALVERIRPTELWGPQAIGAHVDHVAVLQALLALDRTLTLWTDHPYAMRPAVRPSPLANRLTSGRSKTVALAQSDRNAKVEAACAYASQIGFQFGGRVAARIAMESQGDTETFLAL